MGFDNDLFRECFGNVNVPMISEASKACLATYILFLQDRLLIENNSHLTDGHADGKKPRHT